MTVFVVQNQMRMDRVKGKLVQKFDMKPAEVYGKLEYLLPSSISPFKTDLAIDLMLPKLRNYCDDEDYLLLIGNPVLIGLVVATAADFNDGRVNMLQWSGTKKKYLSISAVLFPDIGNE